MKIMGIVSQSDVIQLLARNLDIIEFLVRTGTEFGLSFLEATKTIDEVIHPEDKFTVIRVSFKNKLVDAFHEILRTGVPGVALVDQHSGKLVGNISASDLKDITPGTFFQLNNQIEDVFINRVRL